jgi:hypothetical protein
MAPIPRFDEEATALISSIERRQEDIKIFHLKRLSEAPLNDGHGVEAREDLDTLTRLVEVCSSLNVICDAQTNWNSRS